MTMLISNIQVVLLHYINAITTLCLYNDEMDGSSRIQTEFVHINNVRPSWKTCMHTPHAQHKTIHPTIMYGTFSLTSLLTCSRKYKETQKSIL
jgi:hypothetical protein